MCRRLRSGGCGSACVSRGSLRERARGHPKVGPVPCGRRGETQGRGRRARENRRGPTAVGRLSVRQLGSPGPRVQMGLGTVEAGDKGATEVSGMGWGRPHPRLVSSMSARAERHPPVAQALRDSSVR